MAVRSQDRPFVDELIGPEHMPERRPPKDTGQSVLLLRIGRVAHGHKVPELEQYQRWIVLCIRWPDAALWLQWGGTVLAGQPAEAQLDGIAARRLQRPEIACALHGMDFQQRSDAAALALGLPVGKVAWLADPDLLGFFAREAALPARQCLSDGAHIGFY